MAEDIKGLIEKIQQEGIQTAKAQAQEIEQKAASEADLLLRRARQQAEQIIREAKEEAAMTDEKQKALLSQAGRDILLVVRRQIDAMLQKLITAELRQTLTPELLAKTISDIIYHASAHEKKEIEVWVSKEDLHKLESGFLSKLKDQAKKAVVLKPSEDIHAGFVISFDAGKSEFDFSDKALAEYITTFLKPKLKDILGT